ncbi:hypothetical protein J2W56_005490 [Nocardia kruczakiae]|uniref:S-adenosyl methyltransferase n=1 Tax=Nocardia kruczakiae TaxID=261477 RepID=A0ABU1XMJ6_9NOCA|nr:hypothetical protein [Nocardia kruczakiae]MDR7171729.1 hypothetical protein [Nocardia kruczakiae]
MTERTPAAKPRRGAAPGSIPSTLWACGPAPIEVADSWPPRVLTRALLEYSAAGDRVLLMPATPDAEHVVADLDRVPVSARGGGQVADTDLILATTLAPNTAALSPWTVAEEAATRLRAGGLLVVLARSHRDPDGTFHDPSGELVTAAQNTDLLYLQHLVAVGIHGTNIARPDNSSASGEHADPGLPGAAYTDPTHIDVLVFLQPHDLTTA